MYLHLALQQMIIIIVCNKFRTIVDGNNTKILTFSNRHKYNVFISLLWHYSDNFFILICYPSDIAILKYSTTIQCHMLTQPLYTPPSHPPPPLPHTNYCTTYHPHTEHFKFSPFELLTFTPFLFVDHVTFLRTFLFPLLLFCDVSSHMFMCDLVAPPGGIHLWGRCNYSQIRRERTCPKVDPSGTNIP